MNDEPRSHLDATRMHRYIERRMSDAWEKLVRVRADYVDAATRLAKDAAYVLERAEAVEVGHDDLPDASWLAHRAEQLRALCQEANRLRDAHRDLKLVLQYAAPHPGDGISR